MPDSAKHIAETEKALRNSTFIVERLKRILNDEIDKLVLEEERLSGPDWEREVVSCLVRRKTLREILNLVTFDKKG